MKVHDYGFEICNGRLYAGVGANNVWSARASVVLTTSDLNVWRHVAFAYDGSMVSLFVDGALIGTLQPPILRRIIRSSSDTGSRPARTGMG